MMPSSSRPSAPPDRNRLVAVAAVVMFLALAGSFVLVLKGYVGGPSKASAESEARKHGADSKRRGSTGATLTNANGTVSAPATTAAASDVLQRAALLQRDNRFDEASRLLEPLAAENPFDTGVRLAYAQALIGQQRWKDAYEQYQAALAIVAERNAAARAAASPGATEAATEIAAKRAVTKEEAALHFQAGTVASKAGLIERAEEHFDMAQTGDPAEPRYPLYLGMVQLKLGKDTPAMVSLLRAVKLNPELGEAWGTLAEISVRNNDLGIASQHLDKARSLQPDVARWRLVEARILNRKGSAEQAATIVLALPPAERRTTAALSLLAESFGLLNRPSGAAAAYAEAADASPTNAEFAYQAALWYQKAGEAEKSLRYAKTAAALGDARAADLVKQ